MKAFFSIILAMAVYIYISPNLPGDFATRFVSPERLIVSGLLAVYLGYALLRGENL